MKPLIQFLSELRARDVALNVQGDKLTISAPKNAFTLEMRQELADRKREILAFLRNTRDWKGSQQNARDSRDVLLSRSQQRVWFLDQVRPANPANNIVIPFWLTGTVDIAALDRALRTVVERHESLRTGFLQRNGQAFAWIDESVEWKVDLVDLRELGQHAAEEEAKRLGWHAGRRSFELNKPPLFRATMFQVLQDRHLLVMVVHHIVADGWSLGILSHELTELYREFSFGRPSPLPEPQFQYRDYVHWEREEGRRLAEQQMPYWLDRLGGDLQTLEIPTDRARSASQSSDGGKMIVGIDEEFAERLRKLSREISTTLFNVLLAAFKVLLFRYTASEDILVGSNVANRPRQEFSTQIGFFVNNVLLRTQLSGNPTFVELVGRVTETTRTAYANQYVPFDMIVEKLRPERGLGSHSPLAQIMFTLENLPLPELRLAGLTAELAHIDFNIAGADLAVLIWPVGGGYRCEFEYSTDLFEEGTIGQMQGHYVRLLEEVVKDGERRIGELPLLSDGEREEVLQVWNQTSRGRAGYRTVAEWFGAQASETPDGIAVEMGDQALSYVELDEWSSRVAAGLRKRGIGREVVVGLYVSRSVEMVVCLLGIMKAGGAYLPLDPGYPSHRIAYLVKDSGVSLLVTEESLLSSLPESEAQVVLLEEVLSEPELEMGEEAGSSDDLAYLIYTSGSTGEPKGTEVPQGTLVNLLWSMQHEPGLGREDTLVAVTTLSFDIAGLEIWGPLVSGAKLVVASREEALDPQALAGLMERSGCTVLQATPSTWRMLVESGWMGKTDLRMWSGGEGLPAELADSLLTRGRELWNLYGPTETTIWSAAHRVSSGEDPILIGRPIANTRMYILDERGEPVPVGVAGELYIAGEGVARGYRKRDELTAKRFVPERFVSGGRMYRTGDLARYRRDGEIQLLGRTDEQIKLRGHRIEPGEIEAVLEKHASVQQAIVTVQRERLVAYVRSVHGEAVGELRSWLQERLPEYMVPGVYVHVEELPLTPNGKVDRKRLPAIEEGVQEERGESVAPRTATEQRLAAIWSQVLGSSVPGTRDNFFDLGGHSLLLIRVHAQLREEFDLDIPILDLFRFTTIQALASHIDSGIGTGAVRTSWAPLEHTLSRSQLRLWFMDQFDPGNAVYNILSCVRLTGDLSPQLFERSFKAILDRHESLRTGFHQHDGIPFARVMATEDWRMSFVDFSDLPLSQRDTVVIRHLEEEARRPFSLEDAPLFRATLLRTGPQDHIVLLVVHHIVFDGWSMGVLSQELMALYEAFVTHRRPALLPLRYQYRDFILWEQRQAEEIGNRDVGYWKKKLGGDLPVLELPTDHRRPPSRSFRGRRSVISIPTELVEDLERISRKENATLFMSLFAIFNVLLMKYSRQMDLLVGTPVGGRLHSDFENLIGFFANTLVLRTDLSGNPTFTQLLNRVKETTLEAYQYQNVSFDQLVEELQPERELDRSPIFQVLFTLHNAPVPQNLDRILQMSLVEFESSFSRFDLSVDIYSLPVGGGYRCEFEYSTDLFEEGTIGQMQGHYVRLLEEVVKDGERRIGELPLLSDGEREEVLQVWNQTSRGRAGYRTVAEWFGAQASETPDGIAVEMGDQALSYVELDEWSSRVAAGLRKRGIGREVVVGLYVSRSVEMVVCLLGIMKAGGAYLPLDPGYPSHRIAYLVKDSGVSLLVTEESLLSSLPESEAQVVLLEEVLSEPELEMGEEAGSSDDLAYLIYTSGSTGEPKGTEVPQGTLVNLLWSMQHEPGLGREDTLVAVTTLSFDIAGLEIWGPLVSGAKLVVASREEALDPQALAGLMERSGCTVLQATPSTWRMLVESGWMGKTDLRMWSGGEGLPAELADSLLTRGRELWNLYGPTETTIWSAAHRVSSGEDPILIGRPIANTRMYILDERGEPVPVGVAGELYIAGEGVARGYRKRDELTAKRFVPERFVSGGRMYRTGDLARYRRDGEIQLLGRTDEQIKLRGHRIEPGEIEAVLEKHASVQQAIVTVQRERLVAYVRSVHGEAVGELRSWLQERLPEYMVPGVYVHVEELPLTPNGKVDRKRLPAIEEGVQEERGESVAPRTATEQRLAAIWSQVLGSSVPGTRDNFFDLGGHSLLLIRVHAQLREEFDLDIPILDLFRFTTIQALASHLNQKMQPVVAGGVHF